MIGHCVAILKPIGTMFAGVNSKWPTAFTPALSSNWAPAFSMTPVMMQMKDIGFIVGRNRVFFGARRGGKTSWRLRLLYSLAAGAPVNTRRHCFKAAVSPQSLVGRPAQ